MRYLFIVVLATWTFMSCSPNNVKEDPELQSLIEGQQVEGVVGIFNNLGGNFKLSNRKWFRDSAVAPGSSFAILQTLIGVETGRVKDGTAVLDSVSLLTAFQQQNSVFFQTLSQRIGKDTMQHWLDTLGYARRYDTPKIKNLEPSWAASLRITADEQLGVTKKLYFDQLPFQRRTHEILRNMMVVDDSTGNQLAYKVSHAVEANGQRICWIQGWKEKNQHPDFFVIMTRTKTGADPEAAAKQILARVLADYLP